jgi:hypothetical protein
MQIVGIEDSIKLELTEEEEDKLIGDSLIRFFAM